MGQKVEVDLFDLEYLLELADDYVYWNTLSIVVADRLEEAVNKVKEKHGT